MRKQRQKLEECDKQPCRTFLREDFAIQIIMDCRSIKSKLGLNQHDPVMTQERSILIKIKSVFSADSIIFQHSVLSYRIDAYFPKYKLAIEVDELGYNDRHIDYEMQR